MEHLQACVELPFAVLPESSTFFKPCEGSLDDPSLGHDGEAVQFVAFGDLHGRPGLVLDRVGERLAGVTAVDEDTVDVFKTIGTAMERGRRAGAVAHLGRCDGRRMRQPLHIDCDAMLDAGNLFARVIALPASRISILHALRLDDQEAGPAVAPCPARSPPTDF